jgi:hypothetical protein
MESTKSEAPILEAPNPKQIQKLEARMIQRWTKAVSVIRAFVHLSLFRISCFGFRILAGRATMLAQIVILAIA